jgi:hypothetical protein
MTVIQIRPSTTPQPEPTDESKLLADLNAEIAAVEAKQNDPQGWAKELEDLRARLIAKRAELVALTATTVLAA